jgi:hypothetical protein
MKMNTIKWIETMDDENSPAISRDKSNEFLTELMPRWCCSHHWTMSVGSSSDTPSAGHQSRNGLIY